MQNIRSIFVVLSLICFSFGCVAGVTVKTNGFLNQSADHQALVSDRSIYIRTNSQAENPLFEQEIAGKIKRLLQNQGYEVSSSEDAPLVLEYMYGIDDGKVVTETVPEYHPGDIVHHSGRYRINGQETTYSEYSTTAGYITHVPVDTIVYTRRLTIKVRENKRNEPEPIWIGESFSHGTKEDLREMIDYLLIGAFRSFARNTQKFDRVVIPLNDREVLQLRGQ